MIPAPAAILPLLLPTVFKVWRIEMDKGKMKTSINLVMAGTAAAAISLSIAAHCAGVAHDRDNQNYELCEGFPAKTQESTLTQESPRTLELA